ncbi:hypothetical protein BJY52DRAFT_1225698 [Lactarius psammicola]|nr:hypothetical protein BJY52DRAFT_1225698 [Lactarius psammicola]
MIAQPLSAQEYVVVNNFLEEIDPRVAARRTGFEEGVLDCVPGYGVAPANLAANTTQTERREEADGGQEAPFDSRSAVPYQERPTGSQGEGTRGPAVVDAKTTLTLNYYLGEKVEITYLKICLWEMNWTQTTPERYGTDSPDPDAQTCAMQRCSLVVLAVPRSKTPLIRSRFRRVCFRPYSSREWEKASDSGYLVHLTASPGNAAGHGTTEGDRLKSLSYQAP